METENETFLSSLSAKLQQRYKFPKNEELEEVKMKWCKVELVAEAVHDVCDEHDVNLLDTANKGKDDEIVSELKERLMLAESEQYIKSTAQSSDAVRANILNIGSARKLPPPTETVKEEFRRLVHERIRKKLLAISQFYQPSSVTAGTNLLNAKASQLPAVIVKDVDNVCKNKEEIELIKGRRQAQLLNLQQEYTRVLQLLETILVKYKLSTVHEHETKTVHRLAAKAEALTAKTGLIEKELLADTYTPDIVKELANIRRRIDDQFATTREKLARAESEHHSCTAAGPELKQLANEYAQLKKDIEARTWALEELKTASSRK